MRLAVQDLRTSHIRKRAQRLGRRELWMLYQELLWALYENGGELSSDPEVLADEVGFFSPEEIKELLPLMAPGDGKRGGIVVEGRRIRNPRVSDEVNEAREFSQEQALRGRRGGRAKMLAKKEQVLSERQANAKQDVAKAKPSVTSSSSSSTSTTETTERGENGPPPFPSQRAADIYQRFYPKAKPPRPMFKELRPLVTTHGWGVVAPELEAYLEGTDVRFHNWPKFSSGFGSWAKGRGPHRETPIPACESCQEVAPVEGKLVCAECAEKIAAALKRQDDYKNSRATA